MKKMVFLCIILFFIAGCSKPYKPTQTAEDKEIVKEAEEGAATLEELDEAEKGFWSK